MHIFEFIIKKNLCGKKQTSHFCTIIAILAESIFNVPMNVQKQKIFSKPHSANCIAHYWSWGKTSRPQVEPGVSAGQEANNGHSQTEKNQPLKHKHICWATKHVFINYASTHKPICPPLVPKAEVVCTN